MTTRNLIAYALITAVLLTAAATIIRIRLRERRRRRDDRIAVRVKE